MRAQAEEPVECPVCGTDLWERRPPFRLGPNRFTCKNCGSLLRFSERSQRRIVYVIIAVCAFGPLALLANNIFGGLAGVIAAISGAVIALAMMVWQGMVPQLEVDE